MLVVPVLWLVGLVARHHPVRRTPLNLAILILAVMMLVSLYATYDMAQSFPRLATMVLELGLFFAIVRAGEHQRGWWLALAFFLAIGLGLSSLALVSAGFTAKFGAFAALIARLPTFRSSLLGSDGGLNPNLIAGSLLWVIPTLAAVAIEVARKRHALRARFGNPPTILGLVLLLGILGFMFGLFMLLQSRASYVGFGTMMLIGLTGWVIQRKNWLGLGALTIVTLLAGIVLFTSLVNGVGPADAGLADSGTSVETLEGRLEVWSRAIYAIQDFPFTGMGMDTFRRVVHVLYPLFLIGPEIETIHAHNEYLESALDLGIPGLVAFLALYLGAYTMLVASWRHTRAYPDSYSSLELAAWAPTLILGMGAGLVAHMVYGLFDTTIFIARYDILFWMLLGLIASLHKKITPARRHAPPANPESLT